MRLSIWTIAVVLFFTPFATAEEAAPPANPETTVAAAMAEAPAEPASKTTLEGIREDVDKLLKKLNLEFYGMIKLDCSRDTAETNFGDTAFYVKNYKDDDQDEEINITARHTRFGVNWNGPLFEGITAKAKIEIDFLGKADQKNSETMELQAGVRLRHAWMDFDLGEGWSALAGQAWDVFAPVKMVKANTMVGWGQGNIGFRRPQLRITKKFPAGEGRSVTAKFAIARPVARDSTKLDGDSQDDGEDSGIPDLQAHVGLSAPIFCDKPAKIGFGGYYGWREVGGGTENIVDDEHYESWGICLDFTLPILENLDVLGEVWIGKAMDGYRGGVWQSYVAANGKLETIGAKGACLNVVYRPHERWQVSVGGGTDDPDNEDFHGQDGRYHNVSYFGNVSYKFYKSAWVTLEYERMSTDYPGYSDRYNNRFQLSFKLKF